MTNFVCTPPCSRITLIAAMETMHFFIEQKSLSLTTKILCISAVPMIDLVPMKDCPGRALGQISSVGTRRQMSLMAWIKEARVLHFHPE